MYKIIHNWKSIMISGSRVEANIIGSLYFQLKVIIHFFTKFIFREQETRKIERRKLNSTIYKKATSKNEVALFISFVSDILCYKLISK